ncbi:MAG: DNA polymerase I [Caldilinea sp.]|nr:DNA polymerase I [Caldilineaceae bacterium]MCB9121132.1 DNA polymerase I [Caldilineaceae bacterium]MCB9123210.1 DNA polymerase I [Caldilineaceae bacterium]MCO5212423.1 DNA polymerase I [Caldilinea sp.]
MALVLLIDGHSQAYRAYFGMKTPLSTRKGEPTAAVYGFARKLLATLREVKPDYVAVAFDTGDTWRHAEFPEYKATRDAMPDDMRTQMTRIEAMLRAFNIPILTYTNYEADDILGTLAHEAGGEGYDVLVMTGDRDMFQLVDEQVKILYTSGGPNPVTSAYGLEQVQERYGLTPQQFIDFKALTGDSSDNIPGVPGVGEKTAIKFLQQYGTLDELYAHVDEISGPKTRQSLIDAREQVLRNRRLVTINTDLDIHFDADKCRLRDYDQDALIALFNELEFRSLIKELPVSDRTPPAADDETGQMALFGAEAPAAATAPPPAAGERSLLIVQDAAALDKLAQALSGAERLSYDVETTGTDAMQAALVGLGIAWAAGETAYIPVTHTTGAQLDWSQVVAKLQPFFADPALPKVAHNAKYDLTVLRRHGLAVEGPIDDTLLMAWLLDPASRALGLKALADARLEWTMTELTELIGSGRKQITIDQVAIDQAAAYCGADVDATIRLYDLLAPELAAAGLDQLYATIERPLLPVLTDMEMAGVLLDTDFLAQMSVTFTQRLAELERTLYEVVGHDFNIRSTQQLSQVLFDEMGFPTRGLKKTASGHYSTAVDTLETLAAYGDELSTPQQRVIEIILEQRQLEKLRGTYIDALPALVNPETGRLHTSFSQTGAVTGRLSSSNPNLQNIPIRTEIGREIRRAIVAPAGWQLISADYSQVELRVLAHMAQEPLLVEAFLADQDIHAVTASKLFGVPIEEIDRTQRGLGKTINFATIYGVSEFGLSSRTELTREQARQFLEQYFLTYPRIRAFLDTTLEQARAQGYVQTLLGRKRFFPELQSGRLPYNQRTAVERAAINAPIQGTAADIMKIAMIELHDRLRKGRYRTRLLLQVHDELVLETPPDEQAAVISLVRETMENAYRLDVPLKVDVEVGPNWRDLTEA